MKAIHVSPRGDDQSNGSPDQPLATLAGARDRIRAQRAAGDAGPFTVEIAGGWYFLDEPFRLEPHDSGRAGEWVTYRAAPGSQPIFSGGVRIQGFETCEINGHSGWRAPVPASLDFEQLFVNGHRVRRTRSDLKTVTGCKMASPSSLDWTQQIDQFQYASNDFDPQWRNLQDVKVIMHKRWFESHTHVQHVDAGSQTVHLDRPVIEGVIDSHGGFARYWIENVFEWLGEPGQFYLDREKLELFYIPRFGDRLESAITIAPKLGALLELRGDPFGKAVHHVRFQGLEFRHAQFRYPTGYPGGVQAAYTLPGALVLRGARQIVFDLCTVTQVAQNAIEFGLGCSENTVSHCHFFDLGGGGVAIAHERGSQTPVHDDVVRIPDWREDLWVADKASAERLPQQRVTVRDCSIHDAGKIFLSAPGIRIGDAGGNRILHNDIHHLHYSGISCGWTWVFSYDTRTGDNRIEGNYIHHLNQDELLSDLAGIYTLGPSPGTILRGNVIHDVASAVYGDWGLYLDGSSSYIRAEENVVFRCGYGGLFSNVGRSNLIERNILINDESPDNPALVIGNDGGTLTATVRENLLISDAPQALLHDDYQGHVCFESNTYANILQRFGFARRGEAMLDLGAWLGSGWACNERTTISVIRGTQSGRLISPAAWLDLDQRWESVVRRARNCGPRNAAEQDERVAEFADPRAAVMPVIELDRPMFADELQEFFHRRIFYQPGETLAGRVQLFNRGGKPAQVRLRWRLWPAEAGELASVSRWCGELQPGASEQIPFAVKLTSDEGRVLLEIESVGKAWWPPTGIYLYPQQGSNDRE